MGTENSRIGTRPYLAVRNGFVEIIAKKKLNVNGENHGHYIQTHTARSVSEKISQCQTIQDLFLTGCQAGGGGGKKFSPNRNPKKKN